MLLKTEEKLLRIFVYSSFVRSLTPFSSRTIHFSFDHMKSCVYFFSSQEFRNIHALCQIKSKREREEKKKEGEG